MAAGTRLQTTSEHSPVSTLLNAEMAAAPGVSWDLILWGGKREDI